MYNLVVCCKCNDAQSLCRQLCEVCGVRRKYSVRGVESRVVCFRVVGGNLSGGMCQFLEPPWKRWLLKFNATDNSGHDLVLTTIDFWNWIKGPKRKKEHQTKNQVKRTEMKVKHFLWYGRCSLFAAAVAATRKICKKCHNNNENNNELRSESRPRSQKSRVYIILCYTR